MYKVVSVARGGISRDMLTKLTYEKAEQICKEFDWIWIDPNNGTECILKIEEDADRIEG